MRSEPDAFSIDDLKNAPLQTEHWDGVRNYQARNYMRDQMKPGDQAFFYHSNCKTPGIAGIMTIVTEGYPDFTSQDPQSPYFDPKSTLENPRWFMVDVRYARSLERIISLNELKRYPELKDMPLLQRGYRLSIMPVTPAQWRFIIDLEKKLTEIGKI